jgi:hypothetical protein
MVIDKYFELEICIVWVTVSEIIKLSRMLKWVADY